MSSSDTVDTEPTEGLPAPSPEQSAEGDRADAHFRDRCGYAVFVAGAISAAIYLMVLGRGLTFYYDEWNWIDTRGQNFWQADIQPHNGHPGMIPFILYRLLLDSFGLRTYVPYLIVVIAVNLLCGWLLFSLLRRRIHPVLAGAGASVIMLLGPGAQDLLWPFQMTFLGSVAGGLTALLLIDRNRTRSDIGASAGLFVAVACSAISIPFVVGVLAELLWRRQWRRLWIAIAPGVGFIVWYMAEARGQTVTTFPRLHAWPGLLWRAAGETLGPVVGRGTFVGGMLVVVLAVLVVAALIRSPGRAGRLVMAIVGLVTFWILALVTRGITLPLASRYLYPCGVFVLLIVGELPSLLRVTPLGAHAGRSALRSGRGWTVAGTVAVVAALLYSGLAIYWNTGALIGQAQFLQTTSKDDRAILGAAQAGGAALADGYQPNTLIIPQVSIGPYREAVAAYGSPADTIAELRRAPEAQRLLADQALLGGAPVKMTPVGAPTAARPCAVVGQTTGSGSVVVDLPRAGLVVTAAPGAPLVVGARSFATAFTPVGPVAAGQSVEVRWQGAARSALPWQLELAAGSSASAGAPAAATCGAPAAP